MSDAATHVYLARHKKCGEPYGIIVDHPDHKKAVAREVARWIRNGDCDVERKTLEEWRASGSMLCICFVAIRPARGWTGQ